MCINTHSKYWLLCLNHTFLFDKLKQFSHNKQESMKNQKSLMKIPKILHSVRSVVI